MLDSKVSTNVVVRLVTQFSRFLCQVQTVVKGSTVEIIGCC